jgi:uncharacterized integral membrane protein
LIRFRPQRASARDRPAPTNREIVIRKILTALLLVPIAVVFVAFAVANRHRVTVSLDPFDPARPAFAFAVPLFELLLAGVIGGVVIGGVAAWLRQSKWRRAARLAQARASDLGAQLDQMKQQMGTAEPGKPMPPRFTPQLTIPPPAA